MTTQATKSLIDNISVHSIAEYGNNLTTAIAQIGTSNVTLVIDSSITITADVTVPSNIELKFTRDGLISGAFTLTLNCSIEVGLWQIFGSTVTVNGSPKINEIYPEWFGLITYGTGISAGEKTANTLAIQTTINTVSKLSVRNIKFAPYMYEFNNLYLHYDAVNNTKYSTTDTDRGRLILEGSGYMSKGNYDDGNYVGTILSSTSSTGLASIYCNGDPTGDSTNKTTLVQINNMSVLVNNTTKAILLDKCNNNSGVNNLFVYQAGSGGGIEISNTFIIQSNNVRVDGAGSGVSLGVGFHLHNNTNAISGGFYILDYLNVNNFNNGIIFGELVRADAVRMHGLRGRNIQAGSCVTGIVFGGGLNSFNIHCHTENCTLGYKVINNARQGTICSTTASNVKDAEFGSTVADENYFENITVEDSQFFFITGTTYISVYAASTALNLTFINPRFTSTSPGTDTAFNLQNAVHRNLSIINPKYSNISVEIDLPNNVSRLEELFDKTYASNSSGLTGVPHKFKQNNSAGVYPPIQAYQADVDAPFINIGSPSTPVANTNHISTIPGDGSVVGPKTKSVASGWAYYGMIKLQITTASGTQDIWVPAYTADPI